MPPEVRLLGHPVVVHAGRTVALRAERRIQLLAVLALHGGPVERDRLAALFWPERDNATARRNLRKLAFDAQALPWAVGVESDRSTLAWRVATDVTAFESALAAGRTDDALELYGGPLCDGLDGSDSNSFGDFLNAERARLADRWRSAVLSRLGRIESEPQRSLLLAQRLLANDPFDEEAVAVVLQALLALGKRSEAARAYHSFKASLAEALGLEPSTRLRDLAQRLDAAAGAAAQRLSARTVGSFIGRSRELEEFRTLLARDECRLLTITGPGGIGKSRLAKAALPVLEAGYADSIWWVPLDDLSEEALVAPRIGQVLGIEMSGAADAVEAVGAHLAARQTLLVLDNSEQIGGLERLVERLLARAPRLKLVATSRRRIGAASEWLLPLSGLPVPPEGVGGDAAAVYDAVRLFELHARTARPGFDATREAAAVTRLVRRLGGMPLAIELAAQWVRLLPVAEIESEVATSLDVLERAEEGDERPEHRSVRATFEQSWRLLTPGERDVLATLSTLRAPFTRTAAKAVAEASLAHLASLVDKSLIRPDDTGRFSMHPLVSQFAGEKLAADETALGAARQRHAEFFCRSLDAYASWDEIDQKHAVATVGVELADHLVAYRWALRQQRADLVMVGVGVLGYFFELTGRLEEGLAVLGEAERALAGTRRPQMLARAQAALSRAMIQYRVARFDACVEAAKASLKLYRTAQDRKGIRNAMTAVACGLTKVGQYDSARHYCEQGLRLAEEAGDSESEATFLNNVALIHSQCGHPEKAVLLYERALALTRSRGNLIGIVAQLNNISAALIAAGQPDRAMPHLSEGLRLVDEAGFVAQRSYFLANLAQASFDVGDLNAARRWAEEGLDSVHKGSDRSSEPGCLIMLGRVSQAEGRREEAQRLLRQAAQVAAAMRLQRFMVRAVLAFAGFHLADGAPDEAARLLGCVEACGIANGIELERAGKMFDEVRMRLDVDPLERAVVQGRHLSLDAALTQIAAVA
jgi:predicted ATPase/DNA-binding SARP family transcriptional activator/Tfp pilus assembly protein PilF